MANSLPPLAPNNFILTSNFDLDIWPSPQGKLKDSFNKMWWQNMIWLMTVTYNPSLAKVKVDCQGKKSKSNGSSIQSLNMNDRWFQVEAYWCFSTYLEKVQRDFHEDGLLEKLGKCSVIKVRHNLLITISHLQLNNPAISCEKNVEYSRTLVKDHRGQETTLLLRPLFTSPVQFLLYNLIKCHLGIKTSGWFAIKTTQIFRVCVVKMALSADFRGKISIWPKLPYQYVWKIWWAGLLTMFCLY